MNSSALAFCTPIVSCPFCLCEVTLILPSTHFALIVHQLVLQGYLLMYIKINISCMTLCIQYTRHTIEEVQQGQKVTNNARFLYFDPNSTRTWFSPNEKGGKAIYDDQKDAICEACGPYAK